MTPRSSGALTKGSTNRLRNELCITPSTRRNPSDTHRDLHPRTPAYTCSALPLAGAALATLHPPLRALSRATANCSPPRVYSDDRGQTQGHVCLYEPKPGTGGLTRTSRDNLGDCNESIRPFWALNSIDTPAPGSVLRTPPGAPGNPCLRH
jgi:hypothetical protein